MRKDKPMRNLKLFIKPLSLLLIFSFVGLAYAQPLPVQEREIGPSQQPLPRFISLSAGVANMRSGPGEQYPINWVYKRKLYPLVVISEYENWRQVRDIDGTEGWMHRVLLSGKRTALVVRDNATLLQEPNAISPPDCPHGSRGDRGNSGMYTRLVPVGC